MPDIPVGTPIALPPARATRGPACILGALGLTAALVAWAALAGLIILQPG